MIYIPGSSFLHRLHPLTKLCGALLVAVALYMLPPPWATLVIFALLLLLAQVSGVAQSLLLTVLRIILPVTVSLFLIQGILFPPAGAVPFATLGPVRLTREGLLFAFAICVRLAALSTLVLLVLKVTHPADLTYALTERGMPPSIGYILLVALQLVPDMSARATAILEAQRSRGLETERGFRRVRGVVPLLGPLVVGALVDVEERAMTLEARAFLARGPKTSLRTLVDTPTQRAARVGLLLLTFGLVVARFTVLGG